MNQDPGKNRAAHPLVIAERRGSAGNVKTTDFAVVPIGPWTARNRSATPCPVGIHGGHPNRRVRVGPVNASGIAPSINAAPWTWSQAHTSIRDDPLVPMPTITSGIRIRIDPCDIQRTPPLNLGLNAMKGKTTGRGRRPAVTSNTDTVGVVLRPGPDNDFRLSVEHVDERTVGRISPCRPRPPRAARVAHREGLEREFRNRRKRRCRWVQGID